VYLFKGLYFVSANNVVIFSYLCSCCDRFPCAPMVILWWCAC